MIDDHEPRILLAQDVTDLLDLAGAEQRARFWLGDGNDHAVNDVQVDGERQARRLLQPAFVRTRSGLRNDVGRSLPGLFQDRNDDDGTRIIAEPLELRNDRRRF